LEKSCESKGGAQVVNCGFCNLVHWTKEGDWEEDDNFPKDDTDGKHQEHDDFVSHVTLWGREIVFACDCGGAEDFLADLWKHRAETVRLYRAVSDEMARQLETTRAMLESVVCDLGSR